MESGEILNTIGKVVTQFAAAVQNAGMYPEDHPQIRSYIRETHRLLEALFDVKRETTFLLIGDNLMVDKKPLTLAGTFETAFVQILRRHLLERMTFIKGLPLAELEAFIRSLSSTDVSAVRSTRHITVGKLEIKDRDDRDLTYDDSYDQEIDTTHDLRAQTPEERIKNIYRNILSGVKINLEDTNEIVRHFMENISREASPLRLLAETKSNDEYTFTHTANVGILTLFLAEHLGFKESVLKSIGVAAILHDVGKVTTPDEILSKPGPLSSDERAVMELHAIRGAFNLMEQANITNIAVLGAMEHHMKYDGTGYPRVKGGWEPHIVSQMISIADVYDALRTMRPYRTKPMPTDRIIQIFKKDSGTAFNPHLVERFLNLISH